MTMPRAALGLRTRPEGCLSDLAIERLLVGELTAPAERAAIDEHLASCARCRARRDELRAAPVQVPDPAFWQQAPARPVARGRARRLTGALVTAAALAAALIVALRPRDGGRTGTPPSGERVKGNGVALELVARRGDERPFPVFDGTVLRPGDAVRFLLTAPFAGEAALVGLDGAGRVSLYAPAPAEASWAVVAGKNTRAGSIVLDDSPGEERFVALLCQKVPPRDALTVRKDAQR